MGARGERAQWSADGTWCQRPVVRCTARRRREQASSQCVSGVLGTRALGWAGSYLHIALVGSPYAALHIHTEGPLGLLRRDGAHLGGAVPAGHVAGERTHCNAGVLSATCARGSPSALPTTARARASDSSTCPRGAARPQGAMVRDCHTAGPLVLPHREASKPSDRAMVLVTYGAGVGEHV